MEVIFTAIIHEPEANSPAKDEHEAGGDVRAFGVVVAEVEDLQEEHQSKEESEAVGGVGEGGEVVFGLKGDVEGVGEEAAEMEGRVGKSRIKTNSIELNH